ncbi:MAG: four helix bundle protein [Ignavibacterium album]|uniref:four helix bundle protein n=1 Tax=Ignavibacterium album TaxID=591197 RepID=UPI0026EA82AC|nr:four helix bundle protein [Ignavibacterium album]MCX8105999.1 four helix bundle protein [Ignavibacterium album]
MKQSFKDLTVYKKAFDLAMKIFDCSKSFPKEETYSLTDQIRRSSRSVCASIAEAYRKRRYEAHFISKISDADMENSETQVWLQLALDCNYINKTNYNEFINISEEVGRLLNHMIENPKSYLKNADKNY